MGGVKDWEKGPSVMEFKGIGFVWRDVSLRGCVPSDMGQGCVRPGAWSISH